MLKSWSSNQAFIAMSSGGVGYNRLVKAGDVSLGVKALASEFWIEFSNPMDINIDASAAIGTSNRVDSGMGSHIEMVQVWLRGRRRRGAVESNKVGTDDIFPMHSREEFIPQQCISILQESESE